MSEGWLDLENEETGGTARIPDDPDVRAAYEGRGWQVVELPEPGPFVPDKVNIDPAEQRPDFVELVHPEIDGRHQFPNNPDALIGAADAGWMVPNKDGSMPKRPKPLPKGALVGEQGPEPLRPQKSTKATAGDTPADEKSTERPAEGAATDQEE